MNEILICVLATHMFAIPLFVLFLFADDFDEINFKGYYFDNNLINELNLLGRFCYYILTSFSLFYYYTWIFLSWLVKLIFLKREKL